MDPIGLYTQNRATIFQWTSEFPDEKTSFLVDQKSFQIKNQMCSDLGANNELSWVTLLMKMMMTTFIW